VRAWESQRTADPRKYGLNRYGDFFQVDLLRALAAHHGLTDANWTPASGDGEIGTILAGVFRGEGEIVQPWPVQDHLGRPARAWGLTMKRVPLRRDRRQDLAALAAAVGPETRLVHVQNPHNPSGTSFGQADLERLMEAVAERNPDAYVWVDEAFAPYSLREDFPDSFALIGRDPEDSKLIASRSLSTAHGLAGLPVAYFAASRKLSLITEGVTTGFFVEGAYGWANAEAGVNRMAEKALLALLSDEGEAHLARVREQNAENRQVLTALLKRRGLRPLPSDASFVLARVPKRIGARRLALRLYRRGVAVNIAPLPDTLRISVGSRNELRRLDTALKTALGREERQRKRSQGAAVLGAVATAGGASTIGRRAQARMPKCEATGPAAGRPGPSQMSRRTFIGAASTTAVAAWIGTSPLARAFPPDSFYDQFDLARMIYHENPVGPSPAAVEAVRRVMRDGRTAARRRQPDDHADLAEALLRYNRRTWRSVGRLGRENVMLTMGSAEGLFLAADTFVAGGTLVSEWPAYRIIRERTWLQGGTVIDVPLREKELRPDYPTLEKALANHPEAGLVHFNAQNNPMGTVLLRGEFDAFARRVFAAHPRLVILVDESDREYMEPGTRRDMPDFPAYVARGKNLIHLQTMSHAFALTGLRVGYLLAPKRLIRRMRAKRIPRPVNVFGHAASLAALADWKPQVARSLKTISDGRRYLYGELDELGLRYAPNSQGHFVMLDTGRSGYAVWSALIAQGVLTRFGDEWGMESWIRVNPGLPDENERFIAALRSALNQPDPANPPTAPIPLPGRQNAALRARLEAMRARQLAVARRMPPLEGAYRVTPASVFGR
jgi:histidinol-phosphate aminotransferase